MKHFSSSFKALDSVFNLGMGQEWYVELGMKSLQKIEFTKIWGFFDDEIISSIQMKILPEAYLLKVNKTQKLLSLK